MSNRHGSRKYWSLLAQAGLLVTPVAHAEPPAELELPAPNRPIKPSQPVSVDESSDHRRGNADEVLRLDVLDSAFGTSYGTVYAGLQGLAVSNSTDETQAGLFLGGSPIKGLSLHALLGRDGEARFSPTVTAHFGIWGDHTDGRAIGLLGRYKAEGFEELGGELELGVTGALVARRVHFDLNLVAGMGVEEEEAGEIDAEAKAKVGYDFGTALRVGAFGQGRRRLSGEAQLNGRRNWDLLAGAQLVYWADPVVFALSGGPSTIHSPDVGGFIMLAVAGTASLL